MSAALDGIALRASLLEDRTNWTDDEHWTQADRLLKAARVGVLEGDVNSALVEAAGAVIVLWLEQLHSRELARVEAGTQ